MKSRLLLLLSMTCLFQIVVSQNHEIIQGETIKYASDKLDGQFSSYEVLRLPVRSLWQRLSYAPLHLEIHYANQHLAVDLKPVNDPKEDVLIRISDESGIHEFDKDVPYYLYRGIQTHSSLTICGNYLSGVIEEEKGDVWYIEPLVVFDKGAALNEYVLYRSKDFIGKGESFQCLHEEVESKEEEYQRKQVALGQGKDSSYCVEVELAMAIDHTFYEAYPGNFIIPQSMLRVLTYYNVMESRYNGINALDVNFKINEWFISTCDSCTPWNPTFGQEISAHQYYSAPFSDWVQSPNAFQRNYDIPCAWTHRKLYRYVPDYNQYWGIGGLAGGNACRGHAIISDTSSLGLNHMGSRFAHEVGHALGHMFHDTVGVNWIMSPSVYDTTILFSPQSIDIFYRYLRKKNCLNDCDDEDVVCMESHEEDADVSCTMNWEWAKGAGSEGDDVSNAIAVQGKQLYITGHHADSTEFDQGEWLSSGTSCSIRNMFLAGYNTYGNYQWSSNDFYENCQWDNPPLFNFAYSSSGMDIALGCDDEVAIGGYAYRNTFFAKDVYVNLYSRDYKLAGFHQEYEEDQIVTAVAVNSYGKVISAGYYSDQIRLGNIFVENNGNYDGYVMIGNDKGAADVDGAIIKIGQSGNQNDVVHGVEVDAEDNVYFTGYFSGMARLLDDYGNEINIFSLGDKDAYIAKSDSKGELLWAKTAGGLGDDVGRSLSVNESGEVYMVGSYQDELIVSGIQYDPSLGDEDMFLVKYDTDGTFEWIQYGQGLGSDIGYDVASNESGVFVTGSYENDIDFNGSVNHSSTGGKDIFIVEYDAAGTLVQSETVGGLGDDEGKGIEVDEHKSVYVSGSFEDVIQFGNDQLVSKGGKDIFTAKLYSRLLIDPKVSDATCGSSDGYVSVSVEQGGSGPFSIHWESIPDGLISGNVVVNGYASYHITNLPSGMYRITVRELHTCYEEELVLEVKDDCCMASQYSYMNTSSLAGCNEVVFTDESTTSTGAPVTYWYWTFGDGNTSTAQNPTHVYSTEGTYSVCLLTCTFGCCDMFCNEVIVDGCEDGPTNPNNTKNKRGEIGEEERVYNVYPNPTEGMLYIDIQGQEKEDVVVELYDALGRKVRTQSINGSSSIDISDLDKGVYLLQILAEHTTQSLQKIVKK